MTPRETALVSAARKVLAGLHVRIATADPAAVPVFDGIADLHAAIGAYRDLHGALAAQAMLEGNDLLHAKSMGIDVEAIDAEAYRRALEAARIAHEARVLGLDTDIKMGR